MKYAILAAAAALSLGACTKDLTVGGVTLTPAEQQCIAANAVVVVKKTDGFKDMTTKQKGAYVLAASESIADVCAVDLSSVKPYLDIAALAAAE